MICDECVDLCAGIIAEEEAEIEAEQQEAQRRTSDWTHYRHGVARLSRLDSLELVVSVSTRAPLIRHAVNGFGDLSHGPGSATTPKAACTRCAIR